MDTTPLRQRFELLNGGAELLDRVEPLWSELRRHHAELSPRWSASLLAASFAERRAHLAAKASHGLSVSLAISGARDIGYCVGTIMSDTTGEVDSLFVIASHRGHGVGHALMSAVMDWFGARAIQRVVVDLISGNDDAQRFYARYGFVPRTVRLCRPADGVA
jgi:diamine N-acetyltransferase